MIVKFNWDGKTYQCNLNEGTDLSISYKEDFKQVNCFYAPFFSSQPYKSGSFTGSIAAGAPVNYFNTFINIHGSGTHTECAGHIRLERESVNNIFYQFFGVAYLCSVYPTKMDNGDRVITRQSLELLCNEIKEIQFLILRSLPNDAGKKIQHYSGTNPPYISEDAIQYIIEKQIKHLLVDIPSVDKEEDGGALAAHKKFWTENRIRDCTITELIFVPDALKDGYYFLNLQMASIESDASPSRPVLFRMNE